MATVISDEARARWNELDQGREQKEQFSDVLTFWSPTVNMARDPRWGRTPETYGEDPFLSGVMGTAFVKGLQGDDPRYLKIVSTPKHFAANNEEHNRFVCNPQISEKQLREYYPGFRNVCEGRKGCFYHDCLQRVERCALYTECLAAEKGVTSGLGISGICRFRLWGTFFIGKRP